MLVDFISAQISAYDVLVVGLICVAFYSFLKILYRLYIHPLSKFPGPKIAAATSAFEFYHSVIRDGMFPWKIEELHKQYGPVVRITPNELHFSDPEFYNKIYTGNSSPRDKYAPFYRFTGATHSAFETHDSRLHNSRRLPLLNVFSKKAVAGIEPLIRNKVNFLAERFEKARLQGTPIKLDSAFSALTADITSEYGYGRCLGYMEDDYFKNDIRESLLASLALFHIVRFFPTIMILAKVLPYGLVQWLNPNLSKVLGLRRLILDMTVEELGKMKQGIPSDAIVLKELNNPSIPESERSLERLGDEGFVILNAGVTAGKTLAFTFFHLLNHNKVIYNKLHQQLKEVFPHPEDMDHIAQKNLEALPYLVSRFPTITVHGQTISHRFCLYGSDDSQRGVVYEGLRLSLGPLTRLPRVAPAETLVYKGLVIPPGTGISESNHFLHMNPELFPNPTEFRPERWIEAQEKGLRLQDYIVTFGKGTRHCLGMSLAYVELYMTIAVVVRRFDMVLHETTEKDVEIARDRLFGYPRGPSQGVRIITTAIKD